MKKPFEVLIISCVFPPEPVVSANLSYDLADNLSKVARVTVISPKPTRPAGYNFKDAANIDFSAKFKHVLTASYTSPLSNFIGRIRESISFGLHCKRYILSSDEKYVCIYMNNWPIFAQYFVAKAADRKGIRLVTHIQDIYPEAFIQKTPKIIQGLLFGILYTFERYTLRQSAQLITISEGMKDYLSLSRKLTENKIKVVFNWQDEKRFEIGGSKSNQGEKLTFMFLGTIGPLTNLGFVLESFSELESTKAKFIVAGEGSEKATLQRQVSQYSNADISFIEAHAQEVPLIQSKADVLVLSLKPGASKLALPSKLIAYMLSSRPVLAIVDHESDVSKAVLSSKCGWVANANESGDVREVFKEIFNTSRKDMASKGRNGKNFALRNYTRDINLSKIQSIILEDE